ncbi:MAG: hypothetical protein HQM08_01550 [Candidatus Riflebacteria bacterium]|nr:hypothetical protein [Candidatus Riflebacteria bacterium]
MLSDYFRQLTKIRMAATSSHKISATPPLPVVDSELKPILFAGVKI